jgi:hypothetical protein
VTGFGGGPLAYLSECQEIRRCYSSPKGFRRLSLAEPCRNHRLFQGLDLGETGDVYEIHRAELKELDRLY